jgi:hypothetical protein
MRNVAHLYLSSPDAPPPSHTLNNTAKSHTYTLQVKDCTLLHWTEHCSTGASELMIPQHLTVPRMGAEQYWPQQ